MRSARHCMTAATLLAFTGLVALTGCSTSIIGPRTAHDPDASRIRRNPTPELHTLHQTPDDIQNVIAIMENENKRMLRQDIARALLLDRPSRLTPEPIPW